MNAHEQTLEAVVLEADPEAITAFFPLLQRGVRIKAEKGSSIKALLCDTLGISADYVDKRIQTIFLDGKPVDDPASTVLVEGSRIALSAAMPGLAGATLRRDGVFGVMRSQITHRPEEASATGESCFVMVRLFNLVIKELASNFLAAGIWLSGDELPDVPDRSANDTPVVRRALLQDGREASLEELRAGESIKGTDNICIVIRNPDQRQ